MTIGDIRTTQDVIVHASTLQFGYPDGPLFSVPPHDWRVGLHLVLGDEGTGKSSLLRVLAGELSLRSGVLDYPFSKNHQALAHELYWQSPRAELTPADLNMVARDWVARRAVAYARWSQADFDRHAAALGLNDHLHKPLVAFSTGSLRKLWMVTGWASQAALTLIDEPLAALDRASEVYVQQTLNEFTAAAQSSRAQPSRCVVVTHWDVMQGVDWDDVVSL